MSVRDLQTRLGVTPDGIVGPATLKAVADLLDDRSTQPGLPHFATMKAHLEREEGRVASAYQDHLGFWTIGVGRLIDNRKGGRLTNDEIDMLLANDIQRFVDAMRDWPSWQRVKDDPVRATALLSMCFQMGPVGLARFKTSLAAVANGAWATAAANLRNSLWAKQTPARAKRVIAMIETGRAI